MRINVTERKFSVASTEGWSATAIIESWFEKGKQEINVTSFDCKYFKKQRYVRSPDVLKTILLEEYKHKFLQTNGNDGSILDWGN